MWKILCLILMSVNVTRANKNESIQFPNFVEILTNGTFGGSDECRNHLDEYLRGLNALEIWALKMADSITKFPDGVLLGRRSFPGHFDECVETVHEKGWFKGKHCMVQLPDLIISGDTKIQLSVGICIPSTCNSSDIKTILLENTQLDIGVTENDCSTNELRSWRWEDWFTLSIISVIIMIAIASTIYDYVQQKVYQNETPSQLLTAFSLYKNCKSLFKASQSTAQLKCLHGIRFLSISWVVLGHAYFSALSVPPINLTDVWFKFLRSKSFIPISNAFVSVDSFFFLSGLLVCLVFFRDINKKKSFDVVVAFIHRYIRLTPPFALLILIQATIISRLGNGPFWNNPMDNVEKACRESWWTGLLYVQNYVKPDLMCLGQSWYLSADMQMYWLSPLILYPILWFPVFAPFFILLLVLAAAFTNFAVGFVNDLSPNFSLNLDPSMLRQFKLEYCPFHTRMAPWLIGLGTGYIICGLQAKKIRINLSTVWIVVGWLVSFGLLGGSLFSIARFFDSEYSSVESSFYLAFHRVGWALGLSWVVVACVAGMGGPINTFLSLDIFQPLAKLSYCTFLIHMTLQYLHLNTSRTNMYLRNYDIVYSYFGDLVISNLLAIPVVLLFEFPFSHIDRHFFQKLVVYPIPRPKNHLEKKIEHTNGKEKEGAQTSLDQVEAGKINSGATINF